MNRIVRAIMLCVTVGLLCLAGCVTAALIAPSTTAAPEKGETSSITGRLEKSKNQYLLTDAKSGVTYRFTGLTKSGEAELAPYVGKTVTVRLKVRSTESAKSAIAEFISIVR